MRQIESMVHGATTIHDGYRTHASPESMSAFLKDWTAARNRLNRQILELKLMRTSRLAEIEAGTWPGDPF